MLSVDEPTVLEQILPHILSLSNSSSISVYLIELFGSNLGEKGSLIDDIIKFKFPFAVKSVKPINANPTASRSSGQSSNKISINNSNRGQAVKVQQKSGTEINWLGGGSNGNKTTKSDLLQKANQLKIDKEKKEVNRIESNLKSNFNKNLSTLDKELALFTTTGSSALIPSVCFCSGVDHSISSYIKSCIHCGITLCEKNKPSIDWRCPSCSKQLLNQFNLSRIIEKLSEKKSDLLNLEQRRLDQIEQAYQLQQLQLAESQEQEQQRGRNYSNMAGSFPSSTPNTQLDPLPGQEIKKLAPVASAPASTVLRLVGKSVKRVEKTLVKKSIIQPITKSVSKPTTIKKSSLDTETRLETDYFIDFLDDGVEAQPPIEQSIPPSPFYNPNLILTWESF